MPSLNVPLRLAAAATLLSCSACRANASGSELVCETLGVSGGIVSSHDSVLSLSFRPNSLTEETEVCISPADRPPNGPPFVYGEAYRVRPDIDLGVNLSVTYRFDLPQDTSQTAIGVIRRADYEAGDGRWLSLPITRLEPDNKLVAGTDSRLSMFYGLLDDGGSGVVDPTLASGADTSGPSTTSTPTGDPTAASSESETSAIDTDDSDTDTTGVASDTDPVTTETASASASTSEGTSGSTGGSSSSEATATATETGPAVVDCDNLPAPPFDITQIATVAAGNSEDLAMTGQGTFILADGTTFVEMDGDGNASDWLTNLPFPNNILGLRFSAAGDLYAAMGINANQVWAFTDAGGMALLDTGLELPNGVHVDSTGAIWVSHFFSDTIDRIDPTGPTIETVVTGANDANGVFFDENRQILYWALYGPSQLWSAPVNGTTVGTPVPEVDLVGNTDGLAMDQCGNLYVVDQGGLVAPNPCRIDRVYLDESGSATGVVEEIAGEGDLGNACANAQFGYGFGNEYDQALFITGQAGVVYRMQVGVGGYAIPLPEG